MLGQAALAVTPLASVHRSTSTGPGVSIAGIAWNVLPDDLPRKPWYQEQAPTFFFVVAARTAGIPSFQPPDPKVVKPRYDEQPQPFFYVQKDYKCNAAYFNHEPDPKINKPRYDEQPLSFFFPPILRFVGVPSFEPPDPLPRKPRYDEQVDHEWMLPIRRPTHGWDFQPDILPRPLKIVDYRPMFFRIRYPSTFGTINI